MEWIQQLQLASKIVSMEDRLKSFAPQGPMTVHAVYSRSYLLDLISPIAFMDGKDNDKESKFFE